VMWAPRKESADRNPLSNELRHLAAAAQGHMVKPVTTVSGSDASSWPSLELYSCGVNPITAGHLRLLCPA